MGPFEKLVESQAALTESANVILQQLGGNRFIAMTGAKDFVGSDKTLQFSLPRRLTKSSINKVRIDLTPLDAYDIKTYRIRKSNVALIGRATGIHADILQRVFSDMTGLETHL